MTRDEASRRRTLAWASAAVAAATTIVYVVVIAREDNNPFWDVFPWTMLMLIGTAAALWSAVVGDPRVAWSMATAAAVVLLTLGAVAIFSVGTGFLLAGTLSVLAATASPDVRRRS